MSGRVERRTSWKVVIAYLFVIALCGAMFYYVYNLQDTIQNQRVNISSQNKALDLTNRFTQLVHEAQSEANLFAFTDNPKHLKRFGEINNTLALCADSLIELMPGDQNEERIHEVERLILRKGQISYVLSRQFYYFDPLAEIDAKLESYVPKQSKATTVTTVTQSDTIIHSQPKKTFWQRVGNVFSPDRQDSIVQVSRQTIDTAQTLQTDSLDILNDLKELSEKARSEYKKKVKEYEKKTAELISDDNHLSEQIAELLLALNKEILDSSVVEIEKSEHLIKENSRSSTLIAAAVLLLIIISVILILSDVNKGFRARKAAEQAQQAAEEAQRKTEEIMENRHKMLLTVTHDIKTPLTSIMGNIELMDNTGNEKEVNSIQQSADHILSLLSNLLEFSSLEQGKLQVEKHPFHVKTLCEETASMFEPIAHKKALVFDLKNEIRNNLYADADRLKIKQILSNLISNAIKYTLEGTIGFKASLENGCLVFRVEDSGIGIPDDKLEDIFKPFVRTDSGSQLSEGSGYGLSVVKGLVDLMEGTIEVESEVGKGSLFTVKIPVDITLMEENTPVPVADPSTDQAPNELPAPAPLELVEQRHILIIDDDDTLLTVISNMIGKLGHQVTICRSKNDIDGALEQLEAYDFILTDREMGAFTGNDILKLFKDADADKPVYLMTARMDYTMDIAKQEGFDGFLPKPFSIKDLERLFGRHLREEEELPSTMEGHPGHFPDFPALEAMMDGEEEAIQGILTVFAQSTADNLMELNETIENEDFATAKALCHKMLPMFIQLERTDCVPFLTRMNESRGNAEGTQAYPEWKEEAVTFMDRADALLELLAERYGIEN